MCAICDETQFWPKQSFFFERFRSAGAVNRHTADEATPSVEINHPSPVSFSLFLSFSSVTFHLVGSVPSPVWPSSCTCHHYPSSSSSPPPHLPLVFTPLLPWYCTATTNPILLFDFYFYSDFSWNAVAFPKDFQGFFWDSYRLLTPTCLVLL